jgi:hypothetical protein
MEGAGEKERLIIYLGDDNQQYSCYGYVLEIKEGLITFSTNKNKITIPTTRIVKIKERSWEK